MALDLRFPKQLMKTVIGGYSTIDIPRLDFQTLEEAGEFMRTYGYNPDDPIEIDALWKIFEESVDILEKYILEPTEKIPESLRTRAKVEDIRKLLLNASGHAISAEIQKWSCTLLRVMHCAAHVENDLFFNYTTEIQDQIIKPIQNCLLSNDQGLFLGQPGDPDQIPLMKFETKAFKEKHSMVIKSLSKPESVAIEIFDKMGLRFVTRNIFDAFRVIRYLRLKNCICFSNVVPHQSKNTLYPTNLFIEAVEEIVRNPPTQPLDSDLLDERLKQVLEESPERAEFREKHNPFSDGTYKVIKFIGRSLVRIRRENGIIRFFYPFEVQIMDYQTFLRNLAGTAAHGEYKRRQRKAARERALGEIYFSPAQPEDSR